MGLLIQFSLLKISFLWNWCVSWLSSVLTENPQCQNICHLNVHCIHLCKRRRGKALCPVSECVRNRAVLCGLCIPAPACLHVNEEIKADEDGLKVHAWDSTIEHFCIISSICVLALCSSLSSSRRESRKLLMESSCSKKQNHTAPDKCLRTIDKCVRLQNQIAWF